MVGSVLEGTEKASLFVLGCTYDSDTNHQFMDHILVGIKPKIVQAQELQIPFFKQLSFASVSMTGFPYRVPRLARAARGDAKEPFYGGRDTSHVTKGGTRATCSGASVIHLCDLPVFHGHGLEQGLPIRAHICYRKQSDMQSAERIASLNFKRDGEVYVHWTGAGHLVYAVMIRMGARATWSELLWREPITRLMHNLVPYHFLEVCRMMNKTQPGRNKTTFINPITYLSLHRHGVHNILKNVTWPEGWPNYVGARQTEFFAECQFEAKRRLGPPHGMGCSEWIRTTHTNHRAQIDEFNRQGSDKPLSWETKTLTSDDKGRANELAMKTAVKLAALCSPKSVPENTVTEAMALLLAQYKNWWASLRNVPMDEDDDADSSGESVSDGEDRGSDRRSFLVCVCVCVTSGVGGWVGGGGWGWGFHPPSGLLLHQRSG